MKITHVPYRNIGQYVPDPMSGQVPLGFQWVSERFCRAGRQRRQGARGRGGNRLDALPDVPTAKEAGLPQYVVSGWFALLAPHGDAAAIVARLNGELKAAVEDPAVRARFAQQGAEAIYMTVDQSGKFIGDEIVKYHDIITKAGNCADRLTG